MTSQNVELKDDANVPIKTSASSKNDIGNQKTKNKGKIVCSEPSMQDDDSSKAPRIVVTGLPVASAREKYFKCHVKREKKLAMEAAQNQAKNSRSAKLKKAE